MYNKSIKTSMSLLLSLVGGVLYANTSASATVIDLNFNSLPSTQGWDYRPSTTTGAPGPAESSEFSVDGTTLFQTAQNGLTAAIYRNPAIVDETLPWTLSVRMRVTQLVNPGGSTNPVFGASFGLRIPAGTDSNGNPLDDVVSFGLNLNSIHYFTQPLPSPATFISVDTTIFHDYRIEGTPGLGWELFIDNQSAAVGTSLRSPGSFPGFSIGDGSTSSHVDASAEYTQVTAVFNQVPEPATLSLLVLGGLAMLGRRRRGFVVR